MKRLNLNTAFIFLSVISIALTAFLHIFVRPAYDDFYYVTFLDNGFKGFIDATINHYQTLTGRAFVHILLCPLLAFNMLPFKIWNVCIICALSSVISKISSENKKDFFKYFLCSISVFWLIGISVLCDGALWGAGSLNYLFPAFLIVLYSYIFNKSIKRKSNYFICILTFLSSATVEMSGFMIVFSIIYFTLTNKDAAKNKKVFIAFNFISAFFGYITLFLSGGVGKRLSGNDYYDISLFERIVKNFSLFSRKIFEINGLGILIVLVLLVFLLIAFNNKKYRLASITLTALMLSVLALSDIIYHVFAIWIVALFAFFVICVHGVCMFKSGEELIPFFIICLALSLGVCIVSPVVGYRMLLPSAIFLITVLTKSVTYLNINKAIIPFSLCAFVSLFILIFNFGANSKVIDKNTELTKNNTGVNALVLFNVPDEMFGGGTVPTASNFGEYYIKHSDKDAKEIVLDENEIIRNGVSYVPVRNAEKLGAKVRWHLACAEVSYLGKTYSFSNGAKAADSGFLSEKLSHPVRVINGTTYISQEDFDKLFMNKRGGLV